jgi:hypothetical protein
MRFLFFLLSSALWAVCQGCGQGPELAAVQGVVQHDGVPLTKGGTVLFLSVDHHRQARGQIQDDGSYALKTLKPGDGATPGNYRVTVVTDLEIRGKEVRVICQSPKKYLLKVEAEKENQFVVNISRAEGWKQSIDD